MAPTQYCCCVAPIKIGMVNALVFTDMLTSDEARISVGDIRATHSLTDSDRSFGKWT